MHHGSKIIIRWSIVWGVTANFSLNLIEMLNGIDEFHRKNANLFIVFSEEIRLMTIVLVTSVVGEVKDC